MYRFNENYNKFKIWFSQQETYKNSIEGLYDFEK